MFVFEIVTAGTWLDYDDREWSWRIDNQLRSLKSQFFEDHAALNQFTHVQSNSPSFAEASSWEQDSQRRSEILRSVEQERKSPIPLERWDDLRFEAEVRFKREKWSKGGIPRELERPLPFIFARAFLYALDSFDKFLGLLSKEAGVPESVAEFHTEFATHFPDLRGVRNTAQHLEDRSRGLGSGRTPQPLVLNPITGGPINAPNGGVLVLSCLNGSRYGSTMADGHYGEVDVSPGSMERLQRILQGVLQSFSWRGPRQHAPSA